MNTYSIGNCYHVVSVIRPNQLNCERYITRLKDSIVLISNDDDSFYATEFNSWEEINEFIKALEDCATEAFGPRLDNE